MPAVAVNGGLCAGASRAMPRAQAHDDDSRRHFAAIAHRTYTSCAPITNRGGGTDDETAHCSPADAWIVAVGRAPCPAQTATTTFRVTARVQGGLRSDGERPRLRHLHRADRQPASGHDAAAGDLHAEHDLQHRPQRGHVARRDGQSARKWSSGANTLNYQLYSDSARSTIWGNTTGTDTVTGVGTGLAEDHTVFGTIPAAQVVPAGDYADTITVRIYY